MIARFMFFYKPGVTMDQLYLLDEMKFMPQLSLATSPSEYFAWQDAMENLFAGCGFSSVVPQIAIACRHERKYIVLNNLDALHGKEMKMSPRKFVYIGTIRVEIMDAFPT